MPQYGLISECDYNTITKTLDFIMQDCDLTVRCFEIGVNEGNTSRSIKEYIESKQKRVYYVGVDNQQDFKMGSPFKDCNFIIGDSVQMCSRLPDDFFNFGFIDANHSFHRTISDFVAYAPKIKVGGFLAFHDTNPNIKSFLDYQMVGNKEDERMYIQVRPALQAIGLYDNAFPEWELYLDEYDAMNNASGVSVFKKLF